MTSSSGRRRRRSSRSWRPSERQVSYRAGRETCPISVATTLLSEFPDAPAAEVHGQRSVLAHLEYRAVVRGGDGRERPRALASAGNFQRVGVDAQDGAERDQTAVVVSDDSAVDAVHRFENGR